MHNFSTIPTASNATTGKISFQQLDQLGLNPYEFRIYCHLQCICDESGKVICSIEKIAKACGMHRHTAKRVLDRLVERGMIRRSISLHETTAYHLTPLENWQQLEPEKVCTSVVHVQEIDIAVQQIDNTQQQEHNQPPLKGVDLCSAAVEQIDKPVDQIDTAVQEIDIASPVPEVASAESEVLDLESKIAIARSIGCNVGICWEAGQQFVRINSALKTIKQFLDMSLESFRQALEPCEEGLNLCRPFIQKLIERKKQGLLRRFNYG